MCSQAIRNKGEILPGGVIIVDKPADLTSAGVVRRLKRLPGIKKVGHTGTLDPFATGVLVCPINQGTRLSRFFLHDRKKYRATLRLGEATDTQDHTGQVVAEHRVGNISRNAIDEVFSRFKGDIRQIPPAYSALKHNGVPLYRHARNGNPIEKPARTVHISSIDIRNIQLPDIDFDVTCTAGTYIRTLCADIGKQLGCYGHLRQLDRMESCGFARDDAVSLAELETVESAGQLEAFVIPMAAALRKMPAYTADGGLAKKIMHGRPLSAGDFSDDDPIIRESARQSGHIKILAPDQRLLAVIHVPEDKFDYTYCCVFHYQL